jgi:hypothetical protein
MNNNCSLKDKNYNGNCEGCNNRAYCMMNEIIEKLRTLEIKVNQLDAG